MIIRAAIYARASTDMQAGSVADQLHACRRFAETMGAVVEREFCDDARHGHSMGHRPGITALLMAAEAGHFDLVVAEHTDRMSRGPTDSWSIYEDLKALGVRYVTINQGEITLMHQGMATVMSAMTIEEQGKKTRRGCEGAIRAGRFMGSMPYGYQAPKVYDAGGERVRGLREINELEAEIIRRIFRDTADGLSARAIAVALNGEGVPSPRGGAWNATTIYGTPSQGLGILRNGMYRGRFQWGRMKVIKDRRSGGGRRVPNPAEIQFRDEPELRIVSDDIWEAAHAQLAAHAVGSPGQANGKPRPKNLLSGLILCGLCGGAMTLAAGAACSGA